MDELSELSDRNSLCSFDSWSGGENEEQCESSSQPILNQASKELTELVGKLLRCIFTITKIVTV